MITASIRLGGKPEFAQIDGKGRNLVNIEDKCEIVEVDAWNAVVVKRYSIAPWTHRALAFDSKKGRLCSVCEKRGARTIAVDHATHKLYLPAAEYGAATAATEGKKGGTHNRCPTVSRCWWSVVRSGFGGGSAPLAVAERLPILCSDAVAIPDYGSLSHGNLAARRCEPARRASAESMKPNSPFSIARTVMSASAPTSSGPVPCGGFPVPVPCRHADDLRKGHAEVEHFGHDPAFMEPVESVKRNPGNLAQASMFHSSVCCSSACTSRAVMSSLPWAMPRKSSAAARQASSPALGQAHGPPSSP